MNRASTNLQITVVGVAVLLVVGGVFWFGLGTPAAVPAAMDSFAADVPPVRIAVHVSGAVATPGLVSVAADARVADAIAAAGGALGDSALGHMNLAAPLRDGEHVVVPSTADATSESVDGAAGVDINAASASQLESLPGVGPVLAQRIVDHREANGAFTAVEDLLDVPGIGEAKLAALREAISSP